VFEAFQDRPVPRAAGRRNVVLRLREARLLAAARRGCAVGRDIGGTAGRAPAQDLANSDPQNPRRLCLWAQQGFCSLGTFGGVQALPCSEQPLP
jgi:hypothetical protein